MSTSNPMPLIGVPACRTFAANGLPMHKVSESYVLAVIDGAGGEGKRAKAG